MSADPNTLLEKIIRPEIRAMAGYHIPDATGYVKLDAMENPYRLPDALQQELARRLADVALNRYPMGGYATLKQRICAQLGVPEGYDVILGNGSDELISMLAMACSTPGAAMLAPVPAFVMYAMSAKLAGMQFVGVPLLPDFALDMDALLAAIAEHKPALLYLAYPNNPTGNLYSRTDMERLIEAMDGIGLVVSDEAYQPFAQDSFMPLLPRYPNLVVMRTVSKLGLAGIRLGYMSAHPALLEQFEKVRPPYNVNVLTEAAALFALDHLDVLDAQAAQLRAERARLSAVLSAMPGVEVFPSAANFLTLRVQDADGVTAKLLARRIMLKNLGKMHPLLAGCLRVTVSTPEENALFADALLASIRE
ncbi:MAG TPA: histidinol-phosphate transaminase [Burkholderiaceae bacterium]